MKQTTEKNQTVEDMEAEMERQMEEIRIKMMKKIANQHLNTDGDGGDGGDGGDNKDNEEYDNDDEETDDTDDTDDIDEEDNENPEEYDNDSDSQNMIEKGIEEEMNKISHNNGCICDNDCHTQYVGNGTFTKDELASWNEVNEKMIREGSDENIIKIITKAFIYPKGHEKHVKINHAIEEYFPTKSMTTVKTMVLKEMGSFIQKLFSGQIVNELKAKVVKQEKGKRGRKKSNVPLNDIEIEMKARADLRRTFREDNNLPKKGKLRPEVMLKSEHYVNTHIEKAIKTVTMMDQERIRNESTQDS